MRDLNEETPGRQIQDTTFLVLLMPVAATDGATDGAAGNELSRALQMRRDSWADAIIPNTLFLGSGTHAANLAGLREHNVAHVLNVADDVPCFHKDAGIDYLQLHVADFGSDAGISRVFDMAFEYLVAREAALEPTLVHCAAGANRSATLIVAYMMHSRRMSLREAFELVRRCRRAVCPQKDMRKQLLDYERHLGMSSYETDDAFLYLR